MTVKDTPATGWSIHPSLWFDALCLIPLLADLEFYTTRHPGDAMLWQARLDEQADRRVPEALSTLRDEIASAAGKPLPAFLTLWCSPAAPSEHPRGLGFAAAQNELRGLIAAVDEPDLLAGLMRDRSPHWTPEDQALFARTRPALAVVLRWLEQVGLARWWTEHALKPLEERCSSLADDLAGYDLVPVVERRTGVDLGSGQVEVCLLRWAAPHAIRVTGVRFLADVRYPSTIILNNSVHELLHPPWPGGHRVSSQLSDLHADSFLAARFAKRPPEAGYNDWAGYVEEDAAQALDQVINEHLGIAKDPTVRWGEADEGMHVLALLLFDALRRAGYGTDDETFADVLSRALTDPALWPSDLGARYRELTGG